MISSHFRRVFARFPLAVVLLVGCVYFVLDAANGLVLRKFELSQQLAFAFLSGAVLALAGALYREGHEGSRLGFILALVLPVAAVATVALAPTIAVHRELVLWAAILWLSVAAHIGRGGGEASFAWFNRVAIWEGFIALLLVGTVSAALLAVQYALAMLFGFRNADLVEFGVPLAICLVGPLFWLARLPALSEYRSGQSEQDFLARSLGLVGSWVVTPFLFVYATIFIAYMVQMLLLWRLPSNTIGWMVLSFLVTGAANFLLLAGQGTLPHVRIFRRVWFWLTLPPLLLLIYAAFLRVDAYGITPNRVVLMVGAVWGVALAAFYIARRGDLRLIPFLGAIGLAAIAVGPLNLNLVSVRDQAARLTAVFEDAGVEGLASARPLTPRENSVALAAMTQLFFMPGAMPVLDEILLRFGIVRTSGQYPYDLIKTLGYDGTRDALDAEEGEETRTYLQSWLENMPPLDLAKTPVFLGSFDLPRRGVRPAGALSLGYEGESLLIANRLTDITDPRRLPLDVWLRGETSSELSGTPITFTQAGIDYLALPTALTVTRLEKNGASRFEIERLDLLLFRSRHAAETGEDEAAAETSETVP